jgi:hypothetical protein
MESFSSVRVVNARVQPCTKEVQPLGSGGCDSSNRRQVRLRVKATLQVDAGPVKEVRIFIDTGSEVNLIRRGILARDQLQPARRPVRLWAANSGTLSGGTLEAPVHLRFVGSEVDKKKEKSL